MFKSIVMIIVIFGVIVGEIRGRTTTGRPRYIGCQTNLECMPGNCCTIGPNKFSIPHCKPMQEESEVCRPSGQTLNSTLVYPDGSQVQLTEVHFILCPCIHGLSCDIEDGLCRDASQKRDFNHLSNGETLDD